MFFSVFSVALGGAIGATCRYVTGLLILRAVGPGFPWGTLTVNVFGSFLMGLLFVGLLQNGMIRLNPLLLTGILGGFTTFSAFSLDAVQLYERGEASMAFVYIVASVVLSIAALAFGFLIARILWS